MADNVSASWASDDIGGVQHLRVKAGWGADNAYNDPSVAAPIPVQASAEVNQMTVGGVVRAPQFAVIDEASSGDNLLVAAVADRKIRVLNYVLVSAGTVNATFRSGTTPISGAMPLVANAGISSPHSDRGLFETAVNTALNLNLSAAVGVRGHLTYIEV